MAHIYIYIPIGIATPKTFPNRRPNDNNDNDAIAYNIHSNYGTALRSRSRFSHAKFIQRTKKKELWKKPKNETEKMKKPQQ